MYLLISLPMCLLISLCIYLFMYFFIHGCCCFDLFVYFCWIAVCFLLFLVPCLFTKFHTHLFTQSLVHQCILLLKNNYYSLFCFSFIYLYIYLFIYRFIYAFIVYCLFVCLRTRTFCYVLSIHLFRLLVAFWCVWVFYSFIRYYIY